MNKRKSISESLGFKQWEMATLLQINRSQWSMFESGKRSLPTPALYLLSEMLEHLKSQEAMASDKLSDESAQESK